MSNADELREIMRENKLKSMDIVELIDVSLATVRAWLIHKDSPKHRPIKNRDLEFLRLKIQANKKAPS